MPTVLIGILQFFLAALLIGWLWSIWWGFIIFTKSQKGGARNPSIV